MKAARSNKKDSIFLLDPNSRQEHLLGSFDGEASIGKSTKADIRLNDLRCSGIHALLQKDHKTKEFVVLDLGSHFGTYYRGQKIQECRIREGEVFSIGGRLLAVRSKEVGNTVPLDQTTDPRIRAIREKNKKKQEEQGHAEDVLEVSLFWGDQVLDIRTFTPGSVITLGSSKEATFNVNLASPRYVNHLFEIAKFKKEELLLHLPIEAAGLIWKGKDADSLDNLRHKDKASDEFGDIEVSLSPKDRASIHLGELTLSFKFVHPAERLAGNYGKKADRTVLKITGILIGVYSLIFLWLSTAEVKETPKTVNDIPKHLKKVLFNAGIEKAVKRQQAALGQLAANLQGGRARSDEGKAKAKKDEKKKVVKAPKQVQKKKVTQAKKETATPKIDLDSAFSSPSKQPIINNVSLIGKPDSGNTAAAIAGGGFARGRKGDGAGGGGKSVGIGQLSGNSTGGGLGAGDYGLSPSKGREIKIPEKEEILILGGLDPDIIAERIRRYLPQIQHCYEEQLTTKPNLKGKVTVSFVIAGNGSVSTASVAETSLNDVATQKCMIGKIMKWQFPKPRGGGSVGVKYPFLLMSNTGN